MVCDIPNCRSASEDKIYFRTLYHGFRERFRVCQDCWERISGFGRKWILAMIKKYGG